MTGARELSDVEVRRQAEALAAYVTRGGNASRWLSSKGLAPADRRAVLLAWRDLEDAQ